MGVSYLREREHWTLISLDNHEVADGESLENLLNVNVRELFVVVGHVREHLGDGVAHHGALLLRCAPPYPVGDVVDKEAEILLVKVRTNRLLCLRIEKAIVQGRIIRAMSLTATV